MNNKIIVTYKLIFQILKEIPQKLIESNRQKTNAVIQIFNNIF